MSHVINIHGRVQLQWRAQKSSTSDHWIGVCDAMNLSVEADSLDELHSVIDESIQLVLRDLLHENELEAFLREHGWSPMNYPVRVNPGEEVRFDVPWELIAEGQARDSERRAN